MSTELSFTSDQSRTVQQVLRDARDRGLLGPGSIDAHVRNAAGFAHILVDRASPGGPVLDLGSGGGLPGLVLAHLLPEWRLALVDGSDRRAAWLEEAVERCGLQERVDVVGRRAEDAGHDPALRAGFAAVVSRSFGSPPVTAECGAPFLRDGGVMVVSEPPRSAPDRWPAGPLGMLGLVPGALVSLSSGHYRVLTMSGSCPARYPRRVGVPTKRPLYRTLPACPAAG